MPHKKISLPIQRVQREPRFSLFDRDDTLDHNRTPARANSGMNGYYRQLATLEGINLNSYQGLHREEDETFLGRKEGNNTPSVDTPSKLSYRYELSC